MKILFDENVPKSIYSELKKRGYDAKHVIFVKRGLKDREIIDLANREKRVILTLDEDFVHLSSFVTTKVILIRKKFKKKDAGSIAEILERLFEIEGKVVILKEGYVEVIG